MRRLFFKKTGKAIWISHLDLMRVFQRAFQRAGFHLTHTQGYNPRPSVSIALPMSVGVESQCELLDFDLDGLSVSDEEICKKLNDALPEGVEVLQVYSQGAKIKFLTYLDCALTLEYDNGVPDGAEQALEELFSREILTVEKKSKNGVTEQDIIPLIKCLSICREDDMTLKIFARICCQNPSLNPMQIHGAIVRYLPQFQPDFCKCMRLEVYDEQEMIFR